VEVVLIPTQRPLVALVVLEVVGQEQQRLLQINQWQVVRGQ
jgi:hypothetical protein